MTVKEIFQSALKFVSIPIHAEGDHNEQPNTSIIGTGRNGLIKTEKQRKRR